MERKQVFSDKIIKTAAAFIVMGSVFLIVYLAQEILTPIILAFIFAILLLPLVNFFKRKCRFNDFFATLSSILFALLCLICLTFVMGNQITSLFKDLPQIERNLSIHFENLQHWISSNFDVSFHTQNKLISKTLNSGNVISPFKSLSSSLSGVLINMVLIPIYTFLILIYRQNFIRFAHAFDKKNKKKSTQLILHEINHIIRQYILGLCIEMLIVAFLTGLGLWIIGLKYFVFLGLLTAILNLIPYIGIIVACSISILMSVVGSTDLTLVSGVIVVNAIVQLIDNNILLPKVVGSKVRINALASMLAVVVGGTMAGIAGMFLALPVLAVLKVISDHTEAMNPFTHLIGENTSDVD